MEFIPCMTSPSSARHLLAAQFEANGVLFSWCFASFGKSILRLEGKAAMFLEGSLLRFVQSNDCDRGTAEKVDCASALGRQVCDLLASSLACDFTHIWDTPVDENLKLNALS